MNLTAMQIADACQVPGKPIYIIGSFDTGVTVLSQQTRALNLVWALIETGRIKTLRPDEPDREGSQFRIAIVGGGFAGLSVAAGLLRKGADAQLTIFERCDTLLPLQHGSDTRWLHPNIYNWPAEGSQVSAAMLPVLNWTAARASDVVVQVMDEWSAVVRDNRARRPTLYCNTRHLHIHERKSGVLQIEWIGEKRDAATATNGRAKSEGQTDIFDLVILSVGFGLEREGALSYWRNDTLGQPNLEQPRQTYIVSGQGDGAMVDLLRLRISRYRQDRILGELFQTRNRSLLNTIKSIYEEHERKRRPGVFNAFEAAFDKSEDQFRPVLLTLNKRLRRDTDVILRLKVRTLADLFEFKFTRISFQNKLLVYLLYKCGGFFPATSDEDTLKQQHAMPLIIRRHGTDRMVAFEGLLSEKLLKEIRQKREGRKWLPKFFGGSKSNFEQPDKPEWSSGYFGFKGSLYAAEAASEDSEIRREWRKEYLPAPTVLVAASFCASLAGFLSKYHPAESRLRVTLHRTVQFREGEEALQQCCEYFGLNVPKQDTDARTFPARNATIGLAYRCRMTVRSVRHVETSALRQAMELLMITRASSKMLPDVRFVLAVPILEPETPGGFTDPTPVAGVLYVDSTADGFFIDGSLLDDVVSMTQGFVRGLQQGSSKSVKRIINLPLTKIGSVLPPAETVPDEVRHALEIVPSARVTLTKPFQFNFEYTDFIPVGI